MSGPGRSFSPSKLVNTKESEYRLAIPSAVNGRMAGGGLRIALNVPLCTVFINTPREEDILRGLRIVPLMR